MKHLVLIGLIALGLQASVQAGVSKGTWELGLAGSYSSLDAGGVDIDLTQANVKAGYFASDSIQISGMLTYLNADLDGDSLTATMLGSAIDYYFGSDGNAIVYIGASAYWVDVDLEGLGSGDDFAWDAHAGIKHFIADNVALDYRLSYMVFDDLDLDGISFGIGLSFLF
jgi:hypothetical protein